MEKITQKNLKEKQPEYINNLDIKSKINSKLNFLGQVSETYYNDIMASELNNLTRENSELKFCLEKMNKKFDKEIKELKAINTSKMKEINSSKEIIKKNVALIELLGNKITKYEKIFKEIEEKNKQKNIIDNNIKEKLIKFEKENSLLLEEIKKRDEIINNFKDDVDSKMEMFSEVEKIKLDMEKNLKTMDNLYKEIQAKDDEINKLKKLTQLMDIKQKQEIEKINNENKDVNNNINNNKNINNEDLIKELEKSKEKQKKLEIELKEMQKNYNVAKDYNNKMQELTKEASQMIKSSIDSRDKMKEEYDKAIKELIEKYEKQIKIMKVIIVEQNEKYEKQLAQINKEGENKEININDNKEEEGKNKYLEKLKNDNVMLLNQNSELKNMNEMLIGKMKEIPELNNRFNELFETVKLLKEENDLLKKSMKNSPIMKMLEQDNENENEEEIEEKENDNNKEKENNEEDQKLSNEELQVLENILKDIENGDDKKGDYDINKLQILENILKKLENNKDEENNQENEEEKNNNENDDNNNNDNNIEDLDLQNKLLLAAMLKSLEEEKKGGELNKKAMDNLDNKEKENDSNKKIYNKKLLKDSPGSINQKTDNNKKEELNSVKKKLNQENNKPLEENEEVEDEEEEEIEHNKINKKFNLYKPTKDGMLSFNLSQKTYSLIQPDNYEEFLNVFDLETSVQYNTLEGLFIIPSNKANQLYYYSYLKNKMTELFSLKENHSLGCLFLDNSAKNILAIGGYNSKKVEKFSLENGQIEQLPELPEYISKMTCAQIGNKLYSFFGVIKDNKEKQSPLLCLDLDSDNAEWEEIKFENNADFKTLEGMSVINLNDKELLIIGGIIDDKEPNDKLMYFNFENKKLIKLDKSLPEAEDKKFIFTQNTQFNLFIDGDIILYANIDNNNQVHIIDNELHYDLYLTPGEPNEK